MMVVPSTYEDTIRHIEKIGRICYQSEESIKEGSAEKFCSMLFNKGHNAMIEHSWAVLRFKDLEESGWYDYIFDLFHSPFMKFVNADDCVYVCGNWRAFIECLNEDKNLDFFKGMPFSILNYLPQGDELNVDILLDDEIPENLRAFTVVLKTGRDVTHELVRHRPASFAQESQRYCAYRKDVEFIIPYFYQDIDYFTPFSRRVKKKIIFNMWKTYLWVTEKFYKFLLSSGEKPQEARSVLPNCTATQIAITADVPEWKHIFKLRTSPAAYPQIRNLMRKVEDWLF